MIVFNLICNDGHEFEGWFQNSDDFDRQRQDRHLECPSCGSHKVDKSIMSTNVASSGDKKSAGDGDTNAVATVSKKMLEMAQKVREHVEDNFKYVGKDFPKEARRVHFEAPDEGGVYGEASEEELEELIEDGVDVAPLPNVVTKKTRKKMN